jgi:two-component system, chemotaxis family, sensor kinase Cph1
LRICNSTAAPANNGTLPSYLGLHFPAADIPAQARALYTRNPEREIPDVSYPPVPLVQADPGPVDLSGSMLRSVSPVHVEYLHNMQVGASMSFSILCHGVLWGLLACHHGSAHFIPPATRQACVLLTQLTASQLNTAQEADLVRIRNNFKDVETILLQEATAGSDYREALLRNGRLLLDLVQGTGMVLNSGGTLTTLGEVPGDEELRDLLSWLATRGPAVFETNNLAAQYPPAENLPGAAGILAVPLDSLQQNMIVWFRPELAMTVTWGGEPGKKVAGPGRLTPRASFAAWTETVRHCSRPWERHEIAAASGLRSTIADIILRRSVDLEMLNARLTQTNDELEAFTYVASHDLRDPLRQIETFGSMIERALRQQNASSADLARWSDGIQSSSRRLRALIKDLLEFSRLGRHAHPFTPTDLGRQFEMVLADLACAIEDSKATITVAPLPVVVCDEIQIRQVFQNILSNALKYRDPGRAPLITIRATARVGNDMTPRSESVLADIIITDNGIGFEDRHRERIFEPFQRLHSGERYEGSGIGLAICRKIVNRHGGSISASSQPGVGAVFTITLPVRPVS